MTLICYGCHLPRNKMIALTAKNAKTSIDKVIGFICKKCMRKVHVMNEIKRNPLAKKYSWRKIFRKLVNQEEIK